jgi:succinate dehydrogenase/fumarate reductase flavoprotein subunit
MLFFCRKRNAGLAKEDRQAEATEKQKGVSRRSFLARAGGVGAAVAVVATGAGGAVVAAAASGQAVGGASGAAAGTPSSDRVTEEPPIPTKVAAPNKTEFSCDVLVIGGGFAGLMAAVTAREAGQSVVLIDKGRPGYSGLSPWASSHRWFDPEMGDNAEYVMAQLSRGGQYLSNQNWTEVWIKESKGVYQKLTELGMLDRYDRAMDKGFFDDMNFAGYRESISKHDRHPRAKQILDEKGVEVCEQTMVTNVIRQGDKVVGAIGFHVPSGAIVTCHAKAVILCMGGGVYKPAGWPTSGISHDGIGIGYRLGLPVMGQEFDDFHVSDSDEPANAFYPNGWNYLENMWFTGGDWTKEGAWRAPGAAQSSTDRIKAALEGVAPWDGSRIEEGKNLAHSRSGRADDLRTGKRNSTIPKGDAFGCAAGFGMHLTNGVFCGLDDTVGFTGLTGLYVAGDGICGGAIGGAQYTGGRGFTSNFVSVQGKRAAEAATKYAKTVQLEKIDSATIARVTEQIMAPMNLKKGFSANWALDCLQGIMAPAWTLVVKSRECLNAALTQVTFMREHIVPKLQAISTHDLRQCHEMRNKVLQAEMKLRANLAREESRGSHYRIDFPYRDDKNFLCYIALKKGDKGEMNVSKIDIKEEWKGDLTEDYASRYSNIFFPGEVEALHLNVPKKS